MLVGFNRIDTTPDFCEKIGNLGLGLLRIGFGETINVAKIENQENLISFSKETYATSTKVAACVVFIFLFLVTVPCAAIGLIANNLSKTHREALNAQLAATIFQKYARSWKTRNIIENSSLPKEQLETNRKLCNAAAGNEGHKMPQAPEGNTTVYLPINADVVLKKSGRDSKKRFHQMMNVRKILHDQCSSHLIIPEAQLCDSFIVEKKLPIKGNSYHNMGLYISQPELFDDAIKELTSLFSKIYISDLINSQPTQPLSYIEDVNNFVRYDNLPLYIVIENDKLVGKIGLIDLEHTQNESSPHSLETLVRIFPYHLKLIKEKGAELHMNVDDEALEICALKGAKYLEVGYIEHREWLKDKKPYCDQPFQVSSERHSQLIEIIKAKLIELNQYGGTEPIVINGFLQGEIDNASQELADLILPKIFNNIKIQIEKNQKQILKGNKESEMSEAERISLRSPVLKRKLLYADIVDILFDKVAFSGRDGYHVGIAEQLLCVVMKKLAGKEILNFDPAYYTQGHDFCWMRY